MNNLLRWFLGVIPIVALAASVAGQSPASGTSMEKLAPSRLLVAQPALTITTTSPGSSWALSMAVASEIAVTEYDVEISFRDPTSGNWRYPGILTAGFKARNVAVLPISRESLSRFSATATRWRVRARHSAPPGPWSDWKEFDIAGEAKEIQMAAPSQAVAGRASNFATARADVETMAVAVTAQLEGLRAYAASIGKEGREDSEIARASQQQMLAAKMKQLQDDMKKLQDSVDKLKEALRGSARPAYQKKP